MFRHRPSGISLDVMGTLVRPKGSVGSVYASYAKSFFERGGSSSAVAAAAVKSSLPVSQWDQNVVDGRRWAELEAQVLCLTPQQLDAQFRLAFKTHYTVPIVAKLQEPELPSSSQRKRHQEDEVNFVWCSIISDTFGLNPWRRRSQKEGHHNDDNYGDLLQKEFVIGLYDYFSTGAAYEVFEGVYDQLQKWRSRFGPQIPIVAVTNTDYRIIPALEDLGLVLPKKASRGEKQTDGGIMPNSTGSPPPVLLDAVYSSTETMLAKPDPGPLLFAMNQHYDSKSLTSRDGSSNFKEFVSHWTHIGDEVADSRSALACGCHFAPAHLFFDVK